MEYCSTNNMKLAGHCLSESKRMAPEDLQTLHEMAVLAFRCGELVKKRFLSEMVIWIFRYRYLLNRYIIARNGSMDI